MGEIAEEMEGVISMVVVVMQKLHKQRHHSYGSNKGQWEENSGKSAGMMEMV